MDARKMLAMAARIKDICLMQFATNGFTNEDAALVMGMINGEFQKLAYDRTLLSLIKEEDPEDGGNDNTES